VQSRLDLGHTLLARRLKLREARTARPEVVTTRQQIGVRDPIASEPPLLCGSGGTHLAIVTRTGLRPTDLRVAEAIPHT
jgi:hypothetical protein